MDLMNIFLVFLLIFRLSLLSSRCHKKKNNPERFIDTTSAFVVRLSLSSSTTAQRLLNVVERRYAGRHRLPRQK